ncbi:MAG: DEAD/DEAH box helicase [Anaerolineae bacterium]|jgi:superfamily I DNA/RNA helicase|nr:DEAD/DEAH box helicase [Anaerolineae bacterium]MBT7990871.1 DEAD/DEAH box helicase [Anaerolineae bacterium]
MARILPETPPQNLPGEVLRTFKALKSLPDTFIIWHHLAPWEPESPDFLIINHEGRTLLLKVSRASKSETSTAAQMLLLGKQETPLGEAEERLLNRFTEKVGIAVGNTFETLCIFPNISGGKVQSSRLKREAGQPQWVGRELLKAEEEEAWEALLPEKPLPRAEIEKVRRAFSPEIIVPKSMTVREKSAAERKLGLDDYLLDYDQEQAVKAELELPPEGQRLSTDFRLNIINGVAGSGKTLILLYRLRLLAHQYQDKNFLILTHNRPLIRDMESRFARLTGKDETPNIEWDTFQGWCYRHWVPEPAWVAPLSMQAREYDLNPIWKKHLADTTISAEMFKDELDWLKDQPPVSEKDYLAINRRGRGFGLNEDIRKRVFAAVVAYQKRLKAKGALDWGDVPRVAWRYLQDHPEYFPKYDFILVDEAQFFAPLWFEIIKQLLRSGNSHLFVVADPTQGFLGRGASWRSLGLEARGRSQHLKRSYRTTRQIMEFATLLYRQRLPNERDDDILAPDMLRMPDGILPQVTSVPAAQDENEIVAKEIEHFVRQGYPKRDLLALHAAPSGADQLVEAINGRLGNGAALNAKETYPGDYIRVTSLNAGAGLESAIVFVLGLRDLFEKEQSLRLSDEEREGLIQNNTRKLYMAITRAGQRLVFTYPGAGNSVLDELLAKIKK